MKKYLSVLAIAAGLSATISSESLWTDEAFSAFLASHRSLASLWATLVHGDSSDLQMILYYVYLHFWTLIFGQSEIALRSANVPFICLLAMAMVWASSRLFRSSWLWLMTALCPVVVVFASETRPYLDVIALSFTCLTCLLVYLQSPTLAERKILPWLALLSLLTGALFHMLTLLLGPPLLVVLLVIWRADKSALNWRDWKWPLITGAPLFLAAFIYFAWTLGRGTAYDYAYPDMLSMSSVLFRFAGLSGYSPNRYYDSPVRPFVPAIAISAAIFVSCLALMFRAASSAPERLLFRSLLGGLATGIAQVLVLSFGLHQQIEYRHLSSLLPLLLLLILAGLSRASGQTLCAATALGLIWFISDARLLFSSEYRREDFRAAVKQSLELQSTEKQNGRAAVIALAADPLGAAYYGLSGEGPAPCFPLTGSCRDGLSDVGWLQKSPAAYALFWSEAQIKDWLQVQTLKHTDVILLISRGRHPTLKNSAWWPIVQSRANVSLYQKHGFSIYLLH